MTIQLHLHGSQIFLILLLAIVSISIVPVSAVIFSEDGSNVTVSDLYNLTNSTDTIGVTFRLHFSMIQIAEPVCLPTNTWKGT